MNRSARGAGSEAFRHAETRRRGAMKMAAIGLSIGLVLALLLTAHFRVCSSSGAGRHCDIRFAHDRAGFCSGSAAYIPHAGR